MKRRKIGFGASIDNFTPDEMERLNGLCAARGEDETTVLRRFCREEVRKAPRRFSKHMEALRNTHFLSAEVHDGLACVTLPSGRVFYGYTSKPNHRRAYAYVKDVISQVLSEDTYLLGLDIAHRYATDLRRLPETILPPKGGIIIECGAYLGHKTVRFADQLVGPGGKVLAIEMMPDNAEILRRNIKENGLCDVIDVIEAGVWKEAGTMPVKGKGRQRNSLLKIDKLDQDRDVIARVDTLDAFVNEWGQPYVDLVFMTLNGAEVEALQGMSSSLQVVGAIYIAAPYERDGRPSVEICEDIAKSKGCKVLEEGKENYLLLTTPAFEYERL